MSVGLRLTGDLHVGASDRECVRHVLAKLTPVARTRACREARHVVLRTALAAHHQHQNLVREFSL